MSSEIRYTKSVSFDILQPLTFKLLEITCFFQPWAALTGQEILEAIDEPNRKRLERPRYCPNEHYNIMLKCWNHEIHLRPTFAQLCSVLEDARPEQVRATTTTVNNAR